eukprot:Colp12_sorted_trinity150504_noHs@18367
MGNKASKKKKANKYAVNSEDEGSTNPSSPRGAKAATPAIEEPAGKPSVMTHKSLASTISAISAAPTSEIDGDEVDDESIRKRRVRVQGTKTDNMTATQMELVTVPKSDEVRALLMKAIEECVLFAGMDVANLEKIIDVMIEEKVSTGANIINQGESGKQAEKLYVIESGKFEFYVNTTGAPGIGNRVGSVGAGGLFGELALLYNAPRAATVRCAEDATVWSISRDAYKTIQYMESHRTEGSLLKVLTTVDILNSLTHQERVLIADAATPVKYNTGDVIIREGETGDKFYMIVDGEVIITQEGKEIARATRGQYFGERALIKHESRAATVVAAGPVRCVYLDNHTFTDLCGPLVEIMDRNLDAYNKAVIKHVYIFQHLSEEELAKLSDAMAVAKFDAGEAIIRQGEKADKFFILCEGEAVVTIEDRNKSIAEVGRLTKGSYFGERALITEDRRAATITAVTNVTCLMLSAEGFKSILGPLHSIFKRDMPGAKPQEGDISAMQEAVRQMKLEDLQHTAMLGAGAFGRVTLVKHKKTGETFALKALQKSTIVELNQIEHVCNEKRIMQEMVPHPFVVRLFGTFRDTRYIYLLMELIQGGELFTILRRARRFNNDTARFYAACVVSAFSHLHAQHILYRDLKPENLLLDSQGYIKVVDMGFAKRVKHRTYTVCGTPEYLAPEIVSGSKGHDKGVDWWTLGVLIYEMLVGITPFLADDQMVIYRNILTADVRYPSDMKPEAKNIIAGLLVKSRVRRLGNLKNKSADVMNHPFFAGMDWEALKRKQIPPPFVPQVKAMDENPNFKPEVELKSDAPEMFGEWEVEF